MAFRDPQGRVYRKLRLSVTDRCQLRCTYCMPDGPAGGQWLPRRDILSYEELTAFVALVAPAGLGDVRITGGEPLVRRNLNRLVEALAAIEDVGRIALTTNGILLPEQLPGLLEAGLDAVTVSIDSLAPDTFARLSQNGRLADTLAGIEALAATDGVTRKLNTVVVRGANEGEPPALIRFAAERGMEARFIEFMPFGSQWGREAVVPAAEILAGVEAELGPAVPIPVPAGSTSNRWSLPELGGASFGIIPTISGPLCGDCDRLRLTADGRVLNCLFDAVGVPIRDALRGGDDAAVLAAVDRHLEAKGPGYLARKLADQRPMAHMHQVGG